tara:strand:+ start:91 stop:684 length:594 start_codon:yes stop_codon:yes gene_type:complete
VRNLLIFIVIFLSPSVSSENAGLSDAVREGESQSGLPSVFKSYLNFTRSMVMDGYYEDAGLYLKSVIVNHQGVDVPFSFQLWRIRPETVCGSYKANVIAHSKCSQAAAHLFREGCYSTSFDDLSKARASRVRNMFCQASNTYKPTVASIEAAGETSELDDAKSACNAAIMIYSADPSRANAAERDKQCGLYEELKSK